MFAEDGCPLIDYRKFTHFQMTSAIDLESLIGEEEPPQAWTILVIGLEDNTSPLTNYEIIQGNLEVGEQRWTLRGMVLTKNDYAVSAVRQGQNWVLKTFTPDSGSYDWSQLVTASVELEVSPTLLVYDLSEEQLGDVSLNLETQQAIEKLESGKTLGPKYRLSQALKNVLLRRKMQGVPNTVLRDVALGYQARLQAMHQAYRHQRRSYQTGAEGFSEPAQDCVGEEEGQPPSFIGEVQQMEMHAGIEQGTEFNQGASTVDAEALTGQNSENPPSDAPDVAQVPDDIVDTDEWNCATCTFGNTGGYICQMCDKTDDERYRIRYPRTGIQSFLSQG